MVKRVLLATLAMACLAACGGNSNSPAAQHTATPTPTPTPAPSASASATPDPLALAALLEGRYQGSWNNTTFGTSGPITLDIKVDRAASAVGITLALGGNVFGSPPPAPESFSIRPVAGQTTYTVKSATFGDLSATFILAGLQGSITMKSTNVPNARVGGFDAAATVSDARSFKGTYTITFKDGSAPAQGTFTLAKTA